MSNGPRKRLPSYPRVRVTSTDAFVPPMRTPPELARVVVAPTEEEREEGAARWQATKTDPVVMAYKIKALEEDVHDHENQLRNVPEVIREEIALDKAKSALSLLGVIKGIAKGLIVVILTLAITKGIEWWGSSKHAPPLRYDKDGNPLP